MFCIEKEPSPTKTVKDGFFCNLEKRFSGKGAY